MITDGTIHGVCRAPGSRQLHRYRCRLARGRSMRRSRTHCGRDCDGWRRVPDEAWADPPEGMARCKACGT